MCFSGDSNVTTALVYVLMGEILAHEDFRCTKSTFYITGSGSCVAFWHQAFPQKATMHTGNTTLVCRIEYTIYRSVWCTCQNAIVNQKD